MLRAAGVLIALAVLCVCAPALAAGPVVISGPVQIHGNGSADDIGRVPSINRSTHGWITMSFTESELRDGHFFHSDTFATLNSGDSLVVVLRTEDTEAHVTLIPGFRSTGEANVVILEDVSYTGGDSLAVHNKNRNSSDTAVAHRYQQPDITGWGATLETIHFGSGNRSGGVGDIINGWIMKPNSYYAVVLTSEAAGNDCSLAVVSYKHTDLEVIP